MELFGPGSHNWRDFIELLLTLFGIICSREKQVREHRKLKFGRSSGLLSLKWKIARASSTDSTNTTNLTTVEEIFFES